MIENIRPVHLLSTFIYLILYVIYLPCGIIGYAMAGEEKKRSIRYQRLEVLTWYFYEDGNVVEGGIPLCLASAKIVDERIAWKRLNRTKRK